MSTDIELSDELRSARGRHSSGGRLTPGVNVDRIDVDAGLAMLEKCGYSAWETRMAIEYALVRWSKGEETQAERGAIDKTFHGIDFTSWRMVLAAALARGAK